MVGSGVAAAGSPSLTLGAAGVDSAGADSFAGADSLGVLEDSGAACVCRERLLASDPEPASLGAPEVLGWLDSEECADSDSDEPACGDEAGGLSGVWVVAVFAARFAAALAGASWWSRHLLSQSGECMGGGLGEYTPAPARF